MQDADLLELIGRGDRAAMRLLYERHQAGLYNFICARLGDAFEAADVMQDAFLEVWRAADRFQGNSSVKTWLYGIARNKAVDRIRGSQRVTMVDRADETLADDSPSPLAVIEAAGDAARLRTCLEKLSPAQRSTVRLAFYEDLTYPEVAAVEGIPVGTVKTRIFHAKQALMRCLTRAVPVTASP